MLLRGGADGLEAGVVAVAGVLGSELLAAGDRRHDPHRREGEGGLDEDALQVEVLLLGKVGNNVNAGLGHFLFLFDSRYFSHYRVCNSCEISIPTTSQFE